jgi:cytoskeletal protein CcmA (bactofilin family)
MKFQFNKLKKVAGSNEEIELEPGYEIPSYETSVAKGTPISDFVLSWPEEEDEDDETIPADLQQYIVEETEEISESVRLVSNNEPEEEAPKKATQQVIAIVDESISLSELDQTRVPASNPKLPVEKDIKRRFGENVRSALGPGTVVEGKFSFDEPVRIDGSLTGEVTSTSALIVGENATVNANIKVGSLVIFGQVTGPVQADDLIEIKAGGHLDGNIRTERLVIEDGGWFSGRCNR